MTDGGVVMGRWIARGLWTRRENAHTERCLSFPIRSNRFAGTGQVSSKNPSGVVEQDDFAELQGALRGPAPPPDAFPGKRLRQDLSVHVELGKDELELVGVGIIAQQLHLRQGLDPRRQV